MPKEKIFKTIKIETDFMAISCIISALISIIFCTKFFRYITFPHSNFFTFIYKTIDPLFVQILVVMIFTFYTYRLKKDGLITSKWFIILAIILGIYIFPLSNSLTSRILKPIFKYNRPISQAELFITGSYLYLDENELKLFPELVDFSIKTKLRSDEAKNLFNLIADGQEEEINIDNLKEEITEIKLSPTRKENLKSFYTVCNETWEKHSRDHIINHLLPCSIRVLNNNTDIKSEPWLTHLVKEFVILQFLRVKVDEISSEYWHDSCPSDFGLRSTMILFLALSLLFQKGEVKRSVFKTKFGLIFFISINTFSFLFVILSRIYGNRHTFCDIGIGILFGSFFFFLLIIIIFRENIFLNFLFLALFLIIISLLSIMFSQDYSKVFLPASIGLGIISTVVVLLRPGTQ